MDKAKNFSILRNVLKMTRTLKQHKIGTYDKRGYDGSEC